MPPYQHSALYSGYGFPVVVPPDEVEYVARIKPDQED